MKTLWIPEARAFLRFHDLPGTAPAVVMLHGLGAASSADYPSITHHPVLSQRRFILPDFLGFGFSDRPQGFDYSLETHAESIHRVLRSLGLSQVLLFGHSMGGAIAIALAAAHPELILRICLAEANLDPGIGQVSKMIASQSESDYVAAGHRQLLERVESEIAHDPAKRAWAGTLRAADATAMHRSAVGLIRGTNPPQRQILLSIGVPPAFIFGQDSLPDPDADLLQSQGIRVIVVPRAGHAMMHDNPDGFALAIAQSFDL